MVLVHSSLAKDIGVSNKEAKDYIDGYFKAFQRRCFLYEQND